MVSIIWWLVNKTLNLAKLTPNTNLLGICHFKFIYILFHFYIIFLFLLDSHLSSSFQLVLSSNHLPLLPIYMSYHLDLFSTTPIYPQTNLSFSLLPCSFSLYNSISSSILWSMQVLSRRFSTLSAFPLSSILSLLPSHCSNFACISSNPSFFVFCFFLGDSDSEVASVFARLTFGLFLNFFALFSGGNFEFRNLLLARSF